MPTNSSSIPSLRVARDVRRKRRAEGGAVDAPDEDWREREAREGLALQEPAPQSTWDTVKGVASSAADMAKRFTNYDRQLTEDVLSVPKRIYDNPGAFTHGVRNLLGLNPGEERTQLWPEKMVRSGVSLAHDVGTGAVPQFDPQTGHTSGAMIERAQDMAGMAGGQTLLTGARGAAPAIERAAVAAADSQAAGAPLAALEHAPKFYSGLERAVEAVPQPTMTGQQWLGTLNNKGVKAEEMQWTGLGDYLTAKAGQPVSKTEVAQHLGSNKLELGEKAYGKAPEWERLTPDQQYSVFDKFTEIKGQGGGWRVIDKTQNQGQGTFVGPMHRSGADAEKWLRDTGRANAPVHYMDIPKSLKDEVLQKGFSLFEDSAGAGAPLAALEQGYTGPWYHGGERMDRFTEKGKIDPRRATSGPMPFFTDNPEIASNYAKGKPDTSRIARDEGNVADYFQVSPKQLGISGRAPMSVERSWHFLPPEVKQDILSKAARVGHENIDMAEGPYILHPEGVNATGASMDHWNHIMQREARGNPLAALRDLWHDSGRMVDSPTDLTEIFRLAGYPHQISEANAPWTEAKGVFPGMLRMSKPLQTDDAKLMTETVLPALEEAFKRDRSRTKEYGADMWAKDTRYTPREWVQQAKEDYAKGDNSFVWTSIPDKVTAELRKLGFDGILDTGGKMGGDGHKVAVPFGPEQVRSTFAKFDPKKAGESGLLLEDASAGAPLTGLQNESDIAALVGAEQESKKKTKKSATPPPERKAGGAVTDPALNVARQIRREKGGKVHVGPIVGDTDGRADEVPMEVQDGAYVLTADHCSAMGEGNTLSGFKKLNEMFPESAKVRTTKKPPIKRASGGKVPIYAADGEYVIAPQDILDRWGDLDRGHKILDEWQTAERRGHVETLKGLAPPAQD